MTSKADKSFRFKQCARTLHRQIKKQTMIFLVVLLPLMLIGMLIQNRLRSKFKEFSQVAPSSGLSGAQIAEKMLHDNGIYDVQVVSVPGQLSDHYNPLTKTVNLSEDVFHGRSVAAAAIAAHECGHAVQHHTAYAWLTLRSKLVPVVQFSSNKVQWILLGGVLMLNTFPQLLLIGIALFALTTLFSFITLPVEFDASNRAIAWINKSNVMTNVDHSKVKNLLGWAASTYVVAAVSSLATLLYYVMIFNNRR